MQMPNASAESYAGKNVAMNAPTPLQSCVIERLCSYYLGGEPVVVYTIYSLMNWGISS
jgi:hypothetical protein